MTRKDYAVFAADLAACRPLLPKRSTREQRACLQVWRDCRYAVLRALREDNSNFDWDKFVEATEK